MGISAEASTFLPLFFHKLRLDFNFHEKKNVAIKRKSEQRKTVFRSLQLMSPRK
jgi:hypothetical protein